MAKPGKQTLKQSELRIIGGQWRSRRLSFTPATGLRPTADRVRETLFNWLAPVVHGARCADLFAGSGALGLEALSRGASYCDFVDSSRPAIRDISKHLLLLKALDSAGCHAVEAREMLAESSRRYDIVFVDPPFGLGLVAPVCQQLHERKLLAAGALVYIETGSDEELPSLPAMWALHREKIAGGVTYRLFEVG